MAVAWGASGFFRPSDENGEPWRYPFAEQELQREP
jgi:hypothetical protein